jgi:hypothetical protein
MKIQMIQIAQTAFCAGLIISLWDLSGHSQTVGTIDSLGLLFHLLFYL